MPLLGLSNQWKTFDALINRFAALPDQDAPFNVAEKYRKIRLLLATLNQSSVALIYVGTSHSLMSFSARDVISDNDRTQPFAFVDVVHQMEASPAYIFRVETRRIERNRPSAEWMVQEFDDASVVANLIIDALPYADIPPRRIATDG